MDEILYKLDEEIEEMLSICIDCYSFIHRVL